MTEDEFPKDLKEAAKHLRWEPDDAAVDRVRRRVRARLESREDLPHLMNRWFLPLAASMILVIGLAGASLSLLARSSPADSFDPAAELLLIREDYYRVIP